MSYKRAYSNKGLSARSRWLMEVDDERTLEDDINGNALSDTINYGGMEMPLKVTQNSPNSNASPTPGSNASVKRIRLTGKLDIFPDESELNSKDAPESQLIRRDLDGFYNCGIDTTEVSPSQPGALVHMKAYGNDPAYNGSKNNLRFIGEGEADAIAQQNIMGTMAGIGSMFGGLGRLFGGASPSPSRPKTGMGFPSQAELTEDTQIPDAFIPATTRITSLYSLSRTITLTRNDGSKYTKTSPHRGIDFAGGKRSQAGWNGLAAKAVATKPEDQEPCFATFDGKVTAVTMNIGSDKGYGCVIKIEHNVKDKGGNDRKIVTVYGHIEYTPLKVGDEVKKGDLVAHIGSQGGSTGPHLHYEAREGSNRLDPVKLFGWELGPPPEPDPNGHVENTDPQENLEGEEA